jgi:acyl-CoA synthetase (AMP-forming)/AMP-acid ligase II
VDEIGELMLRGPQVMKGYYNNAQATADTLTEDGWLHTGDIVRMDSDRYVYVLDRKKELIKYKGFQVPPAELEGVLLEHPGISDAAVIGKLDDESGEIPKAFVVRSPDSEVSDADVMAFVAGKVATFKHIREVEFIDAIPKTRLWQDSTPRADRTGARRDRSVTRFNSLGTGLEPPKRHLQFDDTSVGQIADLV